MRDRTLNIKRKISRLKTKDITPHEVIKNLENIARNTPVVIVTCGPSLKSMPSRKLIALREKCILIAVKQSHDYLHGKEDIHLINQFNLKKYRYSPKTYVVASFNNEMPYYKIYSETDLVLPHDKTVFELEHKSRLSKRLAVTRDFDAYLLKNTLFRPWGPGIVMELAIYLAVHMGSKDIILVGYDLAPSSNQVKQFLRFYDSRSEFQRKIDGFLSLGIERIAQYLEISENRLRYELGFPYNKAGSMDSDENKVLVDSTQYLYEWLIGRGISLKICSDETHVSEAIPRININDILDFLRISRAES